MADAVKTGIACAALGYLAYVPSYTAWAWAWNQPWFPNDKITLMNYDYTGKTNGVGFPNFAAVLTSGGLVAGVGLPYARSQGWV